VEELASFAAALARAIERHGLPFLIAFALGRRRRRKDGNGKG
jgi:hypothetical protein